MVHTVHNFVNVKVVLINHPFSDEKYINKYPFFIIKSQSIDLKSPYTLYDPGPGVLV